MLVRLRSLDPRLYQITILAALLLYGAVFLSFEIDVVTCVVMTATALGTQYGAGRFQGVPYDPKSALISALSLCLLLRTDSLAFAASAAFLAIAAKFVVRIRGKHVFNPTNGAIVALILCGAPVWVSPGQWGSAAFFGFLMACLGGLVVNRAARSDVTYAFIVCYTALVVGRSLWVGEPWTIPLHRLESGALLLFTFFMISDPKTTPDTRAGRILFAAVVAFVAWYITFRTFRTNGALKALFFLSPLVPLIDIVLPGRRYAWSGGSVLSKKSLAVVAVLLLLPVRADAFCGFYVAKADTKLFNKSSKVVMVRDEDKTVLTMANDFQGPVKEFAVVVPVPTVITRGQIHIGDSKVIDHLDAYTSPRLVEYFDADPCEERRYEKKMKGGGAPRSAAKEESADDRARSLGVTIEASYTVGEYDILILSAKESGGLIVWLKESGYRIPDGAESVVGSYLKQNMKFFVAKVNLKEHDKMGGGLLRPIQVAYESPKFMLPIRLGTVNANGPQDLFVFALTRTGRVETTNYRTVKLPSDVNVPAYVKDEFAPFYQAMFDHQTKKNDMRVVFTEYAWDMNWCDPCAADPLTPEELRGLGVFWTDQSPYVTRLHVRYDRAHFPEDLVFQATQNRENFQGRYILQHAFKGDTKCAAGAAYKKAVWQRQKEEAKALAEMTGWRLPDIEKKMKLGATPGEGGDKWYDQLWK